MSIEIDDAEKEHLPTHVVACGQRYKALDGKVEETRRRTWRIEIYAVGLLLTLITELGALVYWLLGRLP